MKTPISRPPSEQPLPEQAQKVFTGKIFDVYQWEQTLFNGTTTTFEKLRRPDTVLVIPVTQDDKIILLDEEQPGKVPFLSFVGGRIEEGEDVLAAAEREMLEETGYKAQEYHLMDAIQPISKIEWAVYTFVARGCYKAQEQALDTGEKINLRFISFQEFLDEAAESGFHEIHLAVKVLQAINDPNKMRELQQLMFGPSA